MGNKILISSLIFLIGTLSYANLAQAFDCPQTTVVSDTSVTFVGEVTDLGDVSASAWFEYGQTPSLGLKTPEITLTQPGLYCIAVSGLNFCTTYYYRAAVRNSQYTSYGDIKSFTTPCKKVTVDLKANNSDGPIAIPYNTSAILTWTSTNANYCSASGDWSGTKAISSSETTGNLISTKTYKITCFGPGGSAADEVTISVASPPVNFAIRKLVRNLSEGTYWSDSVSVDPGEKIAFSIRIQAKSPLKKVIAKDILSNKVKYQGNLKIDGSPLIGNIAAGINVGNFSPNQIKEVTFEAEVLGPESFAFGENKLINTAIASVGNFSVSDDAEIIVTRKAAGIATGILTGLTNNFFLDYFLFPLLLASIITWLFKSHILAWEEWLDQRKRKYREYRAKKLLQLKIAQIKAREFFRKK